MAMDDNIFIPDYLQNKPIENIYFAHRQIDRKMIDKRNCFDILIFFKILGDTPRKREITLYTLISFVC